MTDRELLELAAKAAGIVGNWELDKNFKQERWYFNVPYDNQNMLSGFEWNPLTDDGDALRLAVTLCLGVEHNHILDDEKWVIVSDRTAKGLATVLLHDDGDRQYATRRAIVRAAAEIGKFK